MANSVVALNQSGMKSGLINIHIIGLMLVSLLMISSKTVAEEGKLSKQQLMHTLSPVAICDMARVVNPYKKIEECHSVCNIAPQNKGKAIITVYQDVSTSVGPPMVECTKVKLTQVFSETWTFSQSVSTLQKESLIPTVTECHSARLARCDKFECNERPPQALKGEFYYASDHTVEETYLSLKKVPSMYAIYQSGISVLPIHEKIECEIDNSNCTSGDKVYLYSSNIDTQGACPFSPGLTMGCDQWLTGEQMSYVCSDGRFAFESSGSKMMDGICKGLKMSPEGIIYKVEPSNSKQMSDYNNQRISLQADTKLTGDTETLRVITANGLAHLDSDICSLECELASLELRTARRQSTLIRTGAGYMLLSAKGHGYDCSKVSICNVVKPYKFCGEPGRVQIRCNGRDYYWDPSLNYVVLGNACTAPHESDTFRISIGNHLYDVSTGLTVAIDPESTDTIRTRGYIVARPSVIDFENIGEMKAAWESSMKQSYTNSTLIAEGAKVGKHSAVFSERFKPLGYLISAISFLGGSFERIIIFAMIIGITLFFGKEIFSKWLSSRTRDDERVVYVRPKSEREPVIQFL